jgi:tetratricopeptide (TPR) repeat protein
VDLVDQCLELVRALDSSTEAGRREARWALRRARGVLHRLRAAKQLHKVQERQLGMIEPALQKLPPPPGRKALDAPLQEALDDLNYSQLAEGLLATGRARDLVRILALEAADAAGISWAEQCVQQRAIEALVLQPKRYAAALQAAGSLLQEDPSALGAEGRRLLAAVARHAGELDRAKGFDPRALAAPLDDLFVQVLSVRLESAGQPATAARLLGHLIETQQGKVVLPVHLQLAHVQEKAGRLEQAGQTLGRAIRAHPNALYARHQLALVYYHQRRFDASRRLVQDLIARAGQATEERRDAVFLLASLDLEQMGPDQAAATLRKLPAQAIQSEGALLWQAYLDIDRGRDLPRTEATLRKLLAARPQDPQYLFQLGWVLVKQGKLSQGLPLVEKACRDLPANEQWPYDHLGDVYLLAGRRRQAGAAWEKALLRFPPTTAADDRRKHAIEGKLRTLKGKDSPHP